MLNEHIKNIKNEINEYKKAMDDDFTFKEEKGDQAGGPETSKVDRKSGPETRNAILRLISENASITSREMANKLGINRSAVSKHLKKMQDNDIIHREGSTEVRALGDYTAGYGFSMKFTTNSLPRDILVVAAITKSSQLNNRPLEFLSVVWQRVILMADLG